MKLLDKFLVTLGRFRADRRGVTAIEYGVIAAAIVIAIIVVVFTVGNSIFNAFNNVASNLSSTPTP